MVSKDPKIVFGTKHQRVPIYGFKRTLAKNMVFRVVVKGNNEIKCVFNKRTIKVRVSC